MVQIIAMFDTVSSVALFNFDARYGNNYDFIKKEIYFTSNM